LEAATTTLPTPAALYQNNGIEVKGVFLFLLLHFGEAKGYIVFVLFFIPAHGYLRRSDLGRCLGMGLDIALPCLVLSMSTTLFRWFGNWLAEIQWVYGQV
jgi:hypothetical protein